MIIKLEKANRQGVYLLPDGLTFNQVKDVRQDGFRLSTSNYKRLINNEIDILSSHPANKKERIEVEVDE